MKNRFIFCWIFLSALFLLISCSQKQDSQSGYHISGSVAGIPDTTIHLYFYDHMSRSFDTINSTLINDGQFELKGNLDNIDQAILSFGSRNQITFFLENADISIAIDFDQERDAFNRLPFNISGSVSEDLFRQQENLEKAITEDKKYSILNELSEEYGVATENGNRKRAEKIYDELAKQNKLQEERNKALLTSKLSFIKKNGSSPVAPAVIGYQFSERYLSIDEMKGLIDQFTGHALQTSYFRYINNKYESILKTSPGAIAPEFNLKTPEGEDFYLNSLKGKYVLLDFWASWCKPCRNSYPHLKEVYEKYKDSGLEILAISTDSNHDAWKKAIKEDKTLWIHVVDTFSKPGHPADISTLYAVPYLPTTYLLNKKGMILNKNLSENELDKKLEEIFAF